MSCGSTRSAAQRNVLPLGNMRAEEAELRALSDKDMKDNKQAEPSNSCTQSLVGDLLTQPRLSSAPRWVFTRCVLLSVSDFGRFSAPRSPLRVG